jgi:hypothetical protein
MIGIKIRVPSSKNGAITFKQKTTNRVCSTAIEGQVEIYSTGFDTILYSVPTLFFDRKKLTAKTNCKNLKELTISCQIKNL